MADSRVRGLLERFWGRRRNRWLLALLVLLVVVRIALPYVVRRVAVDQADKALVGRIELDDVDLFLVRGGVTLKGLRVFADEKPAPTTASAEAGVSDATPSAPASGAAPAAPAESSAPAPVTTDTALAPGRAPVFAADRLAVNLGFLAFFRKTIEVQQIELEKFAVNVDRARDGTIVLPQPAPSEAPPEPEPEAAEGSGWGVMIRNVRLREGAIGVRDFAVGDPPQKVDMTLPNLDAEDLALLIKEGGLEPGKLVLDAGILDGTLHLDSTIENLPAGPAIESHVVLTGIPIRSSRAYIPDVKWSTLEGRADTDLVHRFESKGAHTLRGRVALRDLTIRVDGLEEPALAWQQLAIDLGSVDVVKQHAKVDAVTLDGLRTVGRPTGPEPVPVLRGLVKSASEAVDDTKAEHREEVKQAVAKNEAPPAPWTWEVGKVLLRDARVKALLENESIELGAEAEVGNLASAPETKSTLSVQLVPPTGGPLAVAGDFKLEPIGFAGTVRAGGLIVPPLARISGAPATKLLKTAVLNLDLDVDAGSMPEAPPDGARVAGTISLSGVEVVGDDPKAFGVRWKDLAIALREVTAPGVLAKGPEAKPGPIAVALSTFTLTRPEINVTRTESGIALPPEIAPPAAEGATGAPPSDATAAAGTAPPAATAAAEPAATPPVQPAPADGAIAGDAGAKPPLDVQVRVDRVDVQRMRIGVTDKAVKPVYRSRLDPVDLDAKDVRWPGPFARDVKLVAKGLDGATFTVTGNLAPTGSTLVAKLQGLPLAPFNPYASASGYGVAGGTAELDSKIKLGPGSYDTSSKLVLRKLAVTGSEGDSLFAAQFGMPLSLALSLMTDLQGDIVIDLPVAGDASGMKLGLGTIVGNALARAILNAVTSPLKLIGAVASIGDKPASLAPQPLVFAPGRDVLAEGEDAKLEEVTKLLAAAPALSIHLRGETSDEDRRWLQEQALRAQLEEESGVLGSIRHVAERGERRAVLAVLNDRAEGKPAEVPEEYTAWFEEKVKAQSVPDSALADLAAARAKVIQTVIVDDGIAAERVPIDEATPDDLAARPVVALGLGAPPSHTPAGPPGDQSAPAVSAPSEGEATPDADAPAGP